MQGKNFFFGRSEEKSFFRGEKRFYSCFSILIIIIFLHENFTKYSLLGLGISATKSFFGKKDFFIEKRFFKFPIRI